MTQQGSDVILRLDEDQALLMRDVRIADLNAQNFYYYTNVDDFYEGCALDPADKSCANGGEIASPHRQVSGRQASEFTW
jgi:hypothetical protein